MNKAKKHNVSIFDFKAAEYFMLKLKIEGIKYKKMYKNNNLIIFVYDYDKKNKKINRKLFRVYKEILVKLDENYYKSKGGLK